MPVLATNKKALSDYRILEEFESGIILSGAEVKAAKLGHVSLRGSFVTVRDGEPLLVNAHIGPYQPAAGNQKEYRPTRDRKLLLKKHEIFELMGASRSRGLTLVPLRMYTKGGFVKLAIALAQGKRKFEKRAAIKKRELDRSVARILKTR